MSETEAMWREVQRPKVRAMAMAKPTTVKAA
jgi:hypothetical protein